MKQFRFLDVLDGSLHFAAAQGMFCALRERPSLVEVLLLSWYDVACFEIRLWTCRICTVCACLCWLRGMEFFFFSLFHYILLSDVGGSAWNLQSSVSEIDPQATILYKGNSWQAKECLNTHWLGTHKIWSWVLNIPIWSSWGGDGGLVGVV